MTREQNGKKYQNNFSVWLQMKKKSTGTPNNADSISPAS